MELILGGNMFLEYLEWLYDIATNIFANLNEIISLNILRIQFKILHIQFLILIFMVERKYLREVLICLTKFKIKFLKGM